MQAIAKRAAVLTAAVFLGSTSTVRAEPTVSNVTMAQISNTCLVQVTYDLGGEDAIVTVSIMTNDVAIPASALTWLSGDVCKKVATGSRSITWNAGADWPENVTAQAKARVTAWSTNAPPQVMVINLSGGPTTNAYPVGYYTSVDALPHGGISNSIYKSAYLAMRKIAKGNFSMGANKVPVNLTQDFYAGVYQVTQRQWYNVMGSTRKPKYTDLASRAFRPMESVAYDDIRGSALEGGAGWPTNNNVYTESFVGRLRARTGLAGFDLPTEAQWEYACRAGTTTVFHDGIAAANVNGANANTNAWLAVLGRYKFNGGFMDDGVTDSAAACSPANGTAIVGSYQPNTWGLYDMHGNVYEWCLDWFAATLEGGDDPRGAPQGALSNPGPTRVAKGGSWNFAASSCHSAARSQYYGGAQYRDPFFGFRLFRTLP